MKVLKEMKMLKKRNKIKCPYCGYEMPLYYDEKSICKGVFIVCKGRNCKKEFEIVINKVK